MRLEDPEGRAVAAVQTEEAFAAEGREEVWTTTEEELRPSKSWRRRGAASERRRLIDDTEALKIHGGGSPREAGLGGF